MQQIKTNSENKSPWKFLGLKAIFTNLASLVFTNIFQMLFVLFLLFCCALCLEFNP